MQICYLWICFKVHLRGRIATFFSLCMCIVPVPHQTGIGTGLWKIIRDIYACFQTCSIILGMPWMPKNGKSQMRSLWKTTQGLFCCKGSQGKEPSRGGGQVKQHPSHCWTLKPPCWASKLTDSQSREITIATTFNKLRIASEEEEPWDVEELLLSLSPTDFKLRLRFRKFIGGLVKRFSWNLTQYSL